MRKRNGLFSIVMFLLTLFAACGTVIAATIQSDAKAKYVFLFIGDGMGAAQRKAAELYLEQVKDPGRPAGEKSLMNSLPAQGMNTTLDLTGAIPDSASTATAIATGRKTNSGTIGMDPEGKVRYENIAETAGKKGWKIGIISTVNLDSATPAAFYAHAANRGQLHEISMQLAGSGFDYFAGGQLLEPSDREDPAAPNAIRTARQNGYTVAIGRRQFQALKPGIGKVLAMSETVDDNAAMYFTLDRHRDAKDVSLAEYLAKGIELLENPKGFFIMVEGGKIDWACHANDAASAVHDVLALDDAIAGAFSFYRKHPEETLIVVTGDHETGGLTIQFDGTRYSPVVYRLMHRKMSYIEIDRQIGEYRRAHSPDDAKLEDLMPLIADAFGLHPPSSEGANREAGMNLDDPELFALRDAFRRSMFGKHPFGSHEPLTTKLTTILDNKAGLAWTSSSHTATPVQTSAVGVGARLFNGCYDQTDIYVKMMNITGLQR